MNERFGLLTVLSEGPREGAQHRRTAVVICACGTQKTVRREHLRSGAVQSCGCHRAHVTAARNVTHGLSYAVPEYRVWLAMRERCSNPNNKFWHRYGGRGIRLCARWWDDFAAFYADMGPRPSPKHSIDRVDNDGPYEPGNCRWATAVEQRANRADSRPVGASS